MEIIPRNKGFDVIYRFDKKHFDTLHEVLAYVELCYGTGVKQKQ